MVSFKIDKQLQTISNYFLFSLAVADLIIGAFSVPLFAVMYIKKSWIFSRSEIVKHKSRSKPSKSLASLKNLKTQNFQ